MKPYCDSCEHADLKRAFCLFYQDEISKVKAKCEIDFRENIGKEEVDIKMIEEKQQQNQSQPQDEANFKSLLVFLIGVGLIIFFALYPYLTSKGV